MLFKMENTENFTSWEKLTVIFDCENVLNFQ